ncbi:MAG TPA: S1/P1 nuclease [Pirellulales bacterium]|jgi:hypothetical protein
MSAYKPRAGAWLTLLIAFAVVLSDSPAQAWYLATHRLIALMAYERLSDDVRTEAVKILRNHESFQSDFVAAMPSSLDKNDSAAVDRWMFCQAAAWPDLIGAARFVARNKHDHPTWHYINYPVFLSSDQQRRLQPGLRDNLATRVDAAADLAELNVVQALKLSRSTVENSNAPSAVRSTALCWLLHLVGDAHQPLHDASLFTEKTFPNGDRGGNRIPIIKGNNLHLFWDSFPSPQGSAEDIQAQAARLAATPLTEAQAEAALSLDLAQWIAESREIAQTAVYSDEVLRVVRAAEEAPGKPVAPIDLSGEYIKTAERVAQMRINQAALRLAALLECSFAPKLCPQE